MKQALLLAAVCVVLAGCAGNAPRQPPAPLPAPMEPPPPPMANLPRPRLPETPHFQTVPEPRTMPTPQLMPDERRRDEQFVVDAMNKVIVPARGNPAKMRALLGMPSKADNTAEEYLADDMVRAMDDPHFVQQLAANMSDAELIQVQKHPSLAMEMAGNAVGHAMDFGFRSLAGAEQKMFLQTFANVFAIATPDECQKINAKTPQAKGEALFQVASRLPAQTQQQLAAALVLAVAQPHGPPQPPLTADERKLVGLNLMHYVDALPTADHDRLLAYFKTRNAADECWAVGHIIRAITSGDDDLVQLGIRMFGNSMGGQGAGS